MFIITILRFILFWISNLGYWEFFRRKSKINIFFIPAFTVSLQITVLFCAGLLNFRNCLLMASILIFVIGIIFAVYYIYLDWDKIIGTYLNTGYAFLSVAVILILFVVRGNIFTSYDNFSHWGLIVRELIEANRYPVKGSLVMFQSYPLGSATFIYYAAKIVSESESFQMFTQAYMMLVYILPVFKYAKKSKIAVCAYIILFTNYIFNYNIVITDLLVDSLLPLQGMAMLFFLFSECLEFDGKFNSEDSQNSKEDVSETVSILYAIPFMIVTVQIKNSGIFFYFAAIILILVSLKKLKTDIQKYIPCVILTILLPFISILAWKIHCDAVFSSAATTKHAMSIDNYKNVFSLKTVDEIKDIAINVLKYSVKGKELYFIVAFLIVVGFLTLMASVEIRKSYLKTVAVSVLMYVAYMIGTLCMYLFSMPKSEALRLASISRYRKTILIAIYYILICVSLVILSSIKENVKRKLYLMICYVMLIINWRFESGSFVTIFNTKSTTAPDERIWIEQAIDNYNVVSGAKYVICIPQADSDYAFYLCKFLLHSRNISTTVITEASQLDYAQRYDYIFLYDKDNDVIKEWVRDNYPDQTGNSVITIER